MIKINNIKKIILTMERYTKKEYFILSFLHSVIKPESDINSRSNGDTLLHVMVRDRCIKAVQFLIDRGIDLDLKDFHGNTALHIAILQNDNDIAKCLIDNKAKLNILNERENEPPIYIAIKQGNIELVEYLVENGADINIDCDSTILQIASSKCDLELVKYLKNKKADINKTDVNNNYVLFTPILNNDINIIKYFNNNGLDLMNYRFSPLHEAANQGNVHIINYLIKNKINIHYKNDRQMNALHYAACRDSMDVVMALVKSGIDINETNINGNTPLILSISEGISSVTEYLVENNVNIHIRNEYGYNALHMAVLGEDLEMIKFLK